MNAFIATQRGTQVPINTDTSSASNLTHALGSSEHRWAESFIESINLGQTTGSWKIQDETTTAGDLVFKKNGSTVARITGSGFQVPASAIGVTTTSSATYSLTSNDNFVGLNCASNTIACTVPSAVGRGGTQLFIKKTDTSLVNNALLNSSGGNIGDTASTTLNTEGELLHLVSDNIDWVILNRYIPSKWTSFTMNVTATTTAPGKAGGSTVDAAYWKREGRDAIVRWTYESTTITGASAGSGTYLFVLPTGINIDTTAQTLDTDELMSSGIGWAAASNRTLASDAAGIGGIVKAYMTNAVALIVGNAAANGGFVDNGFYNFNANTIMAYSFECRFPVQGWKGN